MPTVATIAISHVPTTSAQCSASFGTPVVTASGFVPNVGGHSSVRRAAVTRPMPIRASGAGGAATVIGAPVSGNSSQVTSATSTASPSGRAQSAASANAGACG